MVKRILVFAAIVVSIFCLSYPVHAFLILSPMELEVSFSLLGTYIFHSIFSILIYIALEIVNKQLPTQAGYAFLTAVFLKMGLFTLIFSASILSDVELAKFEKISLVFPFFIFLILESAGSFRLLKDQ